MRANLLAAQRDREISPGNVQSRSVNRIDQITANNNHFDLTIERQKTVLLFHPTCPDLNRPRFISMLHTVVGNSVMILNNDYWLDKSTEYPSAE